MDVTDACTQTQDSVYSTSLQCAMDSWALCGLASACLLVPGLADVAHGTAHGSQKAVADHHLADAHERGRETE